MSGDHRSGEHPAWGLLDAVVYLSAGLLVGLLLAVVLGRGAFPVIIPDSPAPLIDPRPASS